MPCTGWSPGNKQQTSKEGGWVHRSGRRATERDREHLSSTTSHRQIHLPQTEPTQKSQHFSTWHHLIEIKYCEDTRPQNQLSAVQKHHKGLCSILQGASVTLHTTLLGLGGTFYNIHTLEPLWSWALIFSTSFTFVYYAAELVHARRALSSSEESNINISGANNRPSLQLSWSHCYFSFLGGGV